MCLVCCRSMARPALLQRPRLLPLSLPLLRNPWLMRLRTVLLLRLMRKGRLRLRLRSMLLG